MPTMSSLWPVNVVPSTAATPMVFSSTCGSHVVGADRVLARLQRHDPRLDVEVAAELLPDDVHVAAEHQVRARRRRAGGLAALAPVPLQGETAEHDRLGRSLGPGARRLAGRVEEIGEHPDAALLDLGRAGILGVVDEVAVQVRGDDLLGLRLHPRRHEGRQVPGRITLQCQVLGHQPQRVLGRNAGLRELPARNLLGDEPVAEQRYVGIRRLVISWTSLLLRRVLKGGSGRIPRRPRSDAVRATGSDPIPTPHMRRITLGSTGLPPSGA